MAISAHNRLMEKILFWLLNIIISSNCIFIFFMYYIFTYAFDSAYGGIVIFLPLISFIFKFFLFYIIPTKNYTYFNNILHSLKTSFRFNVLFLSGIIVLDIVFLFIDMEILSWLGFDSPNNNSLKSIVSEIILLGLCFSGGVFPSYIGYLFKPNKST